MVVHFQKHGFLVVDEWNIETYVYQRFFYVDGKGMEPETSYIHHDRGFTVFGVRPSGITCATWVDKRHHPR
jgi:hypothetical protein